MSAPRPKHAHRRSRPLFFVVALAMGSVSLLLTPNLGAQASTFRIDEVIAKLEAGVTVARMVNLIVAGCISDGPPTAEQSRRLQAIGASAALFRAVERSPCERPTDAAPGPRNVPSTVGPSVPLGSSFDDAQFARIPAGMFEMGALTSGDADERPVHTVTISRPFLLQRTEVTSQQWRAVMGNSWRDYSSCGETCPVQGVSWDDVKDFLRRLNSQDPGKGYRLPTEAEWEYAARAGSSTNYGVEGSVCAFAWVTECRGDVQGARPVATGTPNVWGVYDMHGNAEEWVSDRYGPYLAFPQIDPVGPAIGEFRVMRSGSWGRDSTFARSASRTPNAPSVRIGNFGFRLARTP